MMYDVNMLTSCGLLLSRGITREEPPELPNGKHAHKFLNLYRVIIAAKACPLATLDEHAPVLPFTTITSSSSKLYSLCHDSQVVIKSSKGSGVLHYHRSSCRSCSTALPFIKS